jgi:hypothetical protein
LAVRAWNMIGGFDWQGIEWVAGYFGIEDVDQLIIDLMAIRDHGR